MKAGCDIDWESVGQLVSRDNLEFGFTFRNPKIMEVLRSMESVTHHSISVGRVFESLGPNVLFMICSRLVAGITEEDMLPVVMTFHKRDVEYVEMVHRTGCHCLGDSGDGLLPLCHERNGNLGSVAFSVMTRCNPGGISHSDDFAQQSSVFRYLRDVFRSGASFRKDQNDDYGQPL